MDRASPTEIRWLSETIPGWWRALLHEWGRLMEAYCRFHTADAPYWYGEIPLTGLLVAAAWRPPDGWGLLEFSAPRKQSDKRVWGAADAWLGQGEGSWCAVEAKLPSILTTNLEDASLGKQERLAFLLRTLGLPTVSPGAVRYQLLHRTASAVLEAESFRAVAAVLLVHSFSSQRAGHADYEAFVGLFGAPAPIGQLVRLGQPNGTPLFAAWVQGDLRFTTA